MGRKKKKKKTDIDRSIRSEVIHNFFPHIILATIDVSFGVPVVKRRYYGVPV